MTITSPEAKTYVHSATVPLTYTATDPASGIKAVVATLDGKATTATSVDLKTLDIGGHTFSVTATDFYGNTTTASVTFTIDATVASLITTVNQLYASGAITKASVRDSLLDKLMSAQKSIAAQREGSDQPAQCVHQPGRRHRAGRASRPGPRRC